MIYQPVSKLPHPAFGILTCPVDRVVMSLFSTNAAMMNQPISIFQTAWLPFQRASILSLALFSCITDELQRRQLPHNEPGGPTSNPAGKRVNHEQPDEVDNERDEGNLPEKWLQNYGTNGERHCNDRRKMSIRYLKNLGWMICKSFVQGVRSLEKCT
jgi:hypothetical protein